MNSFNQLTPTSSGLILINKNDTYIGKSLIKYGEISEAENAIYRQVCKRGFTVVEVGSNIGWSGNLNSYNFKYNSKHLFQFVTSH